MKWSLAAVLLASGAFLGFTILHLESFDSMITARDRLSALVVALGYVALISLFIKLTSNTRSW